MQSYITSYLWMMVVLFALFLLNKNFLAFSIRCSQGVHASGDEMRTSVAPAPANTVCHAHKAADDFPAVLTCRHFTSAELSTTNLSWKQ